MTVAQQLRQQGIQEGIQKPHREIARKLLSAGQSAVFIKEVTDLDDKQLRQLKVDIYD